MLCGEVQKVEVTLRNVGNAPLTNVYIASTDAKLFTLEGSEIDKSEGKDLYLLRYIVFLQIKKEYSFIFSLFCITKISNACRFNDKEE